MAIPKIHATTILCVRDQRGVAIAGDGQVTLFDRLCMMETSVVMQSQELRRTNQLFLRDKAALQMRVVHGGACPLCRGHSQGAFKVFL